MENGRHEKQWKSSEIINFSTAPKGLWHGGLAYYLLSRVILRLKKVGRNERTL